MQVKLRHIMGIIGTLAGNFLSAQPAIDLGPDTVQCGAITLDAGLIPGASYRWSTGESASEIEVEETGTYWVEVTDGTGIGRDTVSVEIVPVPTRPEVQDVAFCGSGVHPLTGSLPSEAGTLLWMRDSTANSVVESGETFSPYIADDTTFYVAAANVSTLTSLGELTADRFQTTDKSFGLRFDLSRSTLIKSVSVFALEATSFTLYIEHRGDTLFQKNISLTGRPGEKQELLLYWQLEEGRDYRLLAGNIQGGRLGLARDEISFPYTIPNWINIYQSIGGGTSIYYYFFDWQLAKEMCLSNLREFKTEIRLPFDLPDEIYSCEPFELSVTENFAAYTWNTGANTPSIPVLYSGVYQVTVSDGEGCVVKDSSRVFFPVAVGLPPDGILCGNKLQTNYTSAARHVWSTGDTTQNILVSLPGTYSVEVWEPNGCQLQDTITIMDFEELPEFELPEISQFCKGDTLSSPILAAQYRWSTQSQESFAPLNSSGLYWLEVENVLGCVYRDSTQVEVIPLPQATFDYTQVGCTFIFTSQVFSQEQEYEWNFGNGVFSSVRNPVYTYPIPANYQVELTVNNVCGVDTFVAQVDCQTVSLKDTLSNSLFVFPNPFNEELIIDKAAGGGAPKKVNIYSVGGKQMIESMVLKHERVTIPTTTWIPGIYILYISTSTGQILIQQLVKSEGL